MVMSLPTLKVISAVYLLLLQGPGRGQKTSEDSDRRLGLKLDEIIALANTEPPLLGIGTKINLADAIKSRRPGRARSVLLEAGSLLPAVKEPEIRGNLEIRLIEVMAYLDVEEAQRLARAIPPRNVARTEHDFKAAAFDAVAKAWRQKSASRADEILQEGVRLGAFQSAEVLRLLRVYAARRPAAAQSLFSDILTAFPVERAVVRDILYLLRYAREMIGTSKPMARQGAESALRALESGDFNVDSREEISGAFDVDDHSVATESTRGTLLVQIAGLLRALEDDSFEAHSDRFRNLPSAIGRLSGPAALAATRPKSLTYKLKPSHNDNRPLVSEETSSIRRREAEIAAMPVKDAAAAVGSISSVEIKVPLLIGLARRPDCPREVQHPLAREAVRLASRMKPGYNRISSLRELLPLLSNLREDKGLSLAVALLAESLWKFCECHGPECDSNRQFWDCMPIYSSLAEYIVANNLLPVLAGVQNPSLLARAAVLQLKSEVP